MKKWLTLVFFLSSVLLIFRHSVSFAQNSDECADKSGQAKISCYEEVLAKYHGQIQTLSNEINKRKTQIKLTTANILQTESEIKVLSGKISRLEVSLDFLSRVLSERIVATYKQGTPDPLVLLFSSGDFSKFMTRYKYLKVLQVRDKRLLLAMEETRANYDDQRTESEKLKRQLENQKATLDRQQKELGILLESTRNQEKIYQDLLAKALAEQAATQKAISQAMEDLRAGKGEAVSTGQAIALLGNSGAPDCSTGTHLHFMVLKDGVEQNPARYLKNAPFTWDNPDSPLSFSGSWDWPISNPRITQSYGETYFSRAWYVGNFHNGIDMVSSDLTIRAPKEGKIIRGATTCDSARVPGVSTLKFAAIGHTDGVITIYLHIQ